MSDQSLFITYQPAGPSLSTGGPSVARPNSDPCPPPPPRGSHGEEVPNQGTKPDVRRSYIWNPAFSEDRPVPSPANPAAGRVEEPSGMASQGDAGSRPPNPDPLGALSVTITPGSSKSPLPQLQTVNGGCTEVALDLSRSEKTAPSPAHPIPKSNGTVILFRGSSSSSQSKSEPDAAGVEQDGTMNLKDVTNKTNERSIPDGNSTVKAPDAQGSAVDNRATHAFPTNELIDDRSGKHDLQKSCKENIKVHTEQARSMEQNHSMPSMSEFLGLESPEVSNANERPRPPSLSTARKGGLKAGKTVGAHRVKPRDSIRRKDPRCDRQERIPVRIGRTVVTAPVTISIRDEATNDGSHTIRLPVSSDADGGVSDLVNGAMNAGSSNRRDESEKMKIPHPSGADLEEGEIQDKTDAVTLHVLKPRVSADPKLCWIFPEDVARLPDDVAGFDIRLTNLLSFMMALSVCEFNEASNEALCSHCAAPFTGFAKLREHLGRVTNFFPYACKLCTFKCVAQKKALKHRIQIHKFKKGDGK